MGYIDQGASFCSAPSAGAHRDGGLDSGLQHRSPLISRRTFIVANAALAATSLAPLPSYSAATEVTRILTLAQRAKDEMKAPALAYGVIRDGKIQATQGLGAGNGAAAVDSRSLFSFGSTVRLFVATAIAQKVEQGRLRLDQRMSAMLPEWRNSDPRAKSMTIEHVLTSSSGLPDLTEVSADLRDSDDSALHRYVASLPDLQLKFAPGQGFGSSGLGFVLLARVIEIVEGVPFETALRRSILEPLRMQRSTLLLSKADLEAVATPHLIDEHGQPRPSERLPYYRPHAAGSTMLSSVDDMLRWLLVNLNDGELDGVRILSAQSARTLRTARPVDIAIKGFPPGVKPALAWYVLPRDGREIVAQGNSRQGYSSLCLFCARERFGLVAVANASNPHGPDSLRSFALAVIDQGLLSPTSI